MEFFSLDSQEFNVPVLGKDLLVSHEERIVRVAERVEPSVVSIVISKDVPILEKYYYDPFSQYRSYFGYDFGYLVPQYRQKGTQHVEVGGGTGFIVSSDGMVVTNKHVVDDINAKYTVFTNSGDSYKAEVLARDPIQDIAILKIEAHELVPVKLGNSDELRVGQTVVAIGNVLAEFRNSVSVGIVSGLMRDVVVSGEQLDDIIQTDAAINQGNSGGPLLNLDGEVVGMNTAMAVNAENVGFTIPVNRIKRDVEQAREIGEIVYPYLGIYYTSTEEGLEVTGVFDDSPAQRAGLQKGDVIVSIDRERIEEKDDLSSILSKYMPGDAVTLEILREKESIDISVVLERHK